MLISLVELELKTYKKQNKCFFVRSRKLLKSTYRDRCLQAGQYNRICKLVKGCQFNSRQLSADFHATEEFKRDAAVTPNEEESGGKTGGPAFIGAPVEKPSPRPLLNYLCKQRRAALCLCNLSLVLPLISDSINYFDSRKTGLHTYGFAEHIFAK